MNITGIIVRAAFCLAVTACAGGNARDIYAGSLTPTAGACEPAGSATLIRRGRFVEFTPREGVLILNGTVAPDGRVTAALVTAGADRKPYRLELRAQLQTDKIAGEYVTPRCRYAVKLALE